MPAPSLNNLHLQYRLWIAEMNFDINLIRIFNDYLDDRRSRVVKSALLGKIEKASKHLVSIRTEIDELKNELHLGKMRLAGILRKKNMPENAEDQMDSHEAILKLYQDFRAKFEVLRNEILQLGE